MASVISTLPSSAKLRARKRALGETSIRQLCAVRRDAHGQPGPQVECPQRAVRRKFEPVDEMRGALDPQQPPGLEVGVELQDPAAAGVVVVGVVQQRRADEYVAARERLQRFRYRRRRIGCPLAAIVAIRARQPKRIRQNNGEQMYPLRADGFVRRVHFRCPGSVEPADLDGRVDDVQLRRGSARGSDPQAADRNLRSRFLPHRCRGRCSTGADP